MLKGLFLLGAREFELIYGEPEQKEISRLVELVGSPQTRDCVKQNPGILRDVDVIFSGWGAPRMEQEFLDAARNLKAVFYGAGSIKGIVTDAFWDRGIVITSAYGANAIPVAEYTLSQILFCLKRGWYFALSIKAHGEYPPKDNVPAAYGSTVGIISLGMVGRRVCELLRTFDLKVIAYDPYISSESAADLNVELCSLEDIFREADVVSLHTPWLKETEGMITGAHLESMKPYATFINTARGAIVQEEEMIRVLQKRADLQAVLDVTYPEPPLPGSPLYSLSNVVLTPHIAGSMGAECRRQGQYMVEELRRYINGEPLRWGITREKAVILA
jgi:phosphoglycerate dehydrogenase-like enzyme